LLFLGSTGSPSPGRMVYTGYMGYIIGKRCFIQVDLNFCLAYILLLSSLLFTINSW
jgi:hypothetical protein